MPQFYDITAPLSNHMPSWPGNPAVEIRQAASMALGHMANTKHLSLPNHTGTHMDAPLHFVNNGKSLDDLPLEVVCGSARVIHLDHAGPIRAEQLIEAGIESETRLLIRTRNSDVQWWTQPFLDTFSYLSTEAAQYLATTKLKLIGIDYLSVAGYNTNELEVHQAILGKGIWIVEGLALAHVQPGNYKLCCLPLKLQQGDGAPCRAILEKE